MKDVPNLVGITRTLIDDHLALYRRYVEELRGLEEAYPRVAWGRAPSDLSLLPSEIQRLLDTRVSDLDLDKGISGPLEAAMSIVKSELNYSGISWTPPVALVDGGIYTPQGASIVCAPWYLANPALDWIVNQLTSQISLDDLVRMMRHEVAHALFYAFGLDGRADWADVFGNHRRSYDEDYVPDPDSRDFVLHLHEGAGWRNVHYAQKHPEEDWAETFAVWLTPGLDWATEYLKGTGARRKLEYVDCLVREEGALSGEPPNQSVPRFLNDYWRNVPGTVREYVGRKTGWSNHAAMIRREPFLYNAVRLHELYFEQLDPAGASEIPEPLRAAVTEAFGTVDGWLMDLRSICRATTGWAVSAFAGGRVRNFLVESHDRGLPVDGAPLLAIDCWEHAYARDYGVRRDLYVGAFFRNLDWSVVGRRFESCRTV